jgi:hypothetical protein
MKIIIYFFLSIFLSNFGNAQASFDIDEGKPYLQNGLEYGFEIRNERKKELKKEDYSRYEITAYVTNKSGCTKLMFPNKTLLGNDYQDVMADFDCLNATGKRLTAKSAKVRAKDFNAPYTYTTKGTDGKDIRNSTTVKVGNMLRNGETVTNNFIVIVPDGERPHMKVRVIETID